MRKRITQNVNDTEKIEIWVKTPRCYWIFYRDEFFSSIIFNNNFYSPSRLKAIKKKINKIPVAHYGIYTDYIIRLINNKCVIGTLFFYVYTIEWLIEQCVLYNYKIVLKFVQRRLVYAIWIHISGVILYLFALLYMRYYTVRTKDFLRN